MTRRKLSDKIEGETVFEWIHGAHTFSIIRLYAPVQKGASLRNFVLLHNGEVAISGWHAELELAIGRAYYIVAAHEDKHIEYLEQRIRDLEAHMQRAGLKTPMASKPTPKAENKYKPKWVLLTKDGTLFIIKSVSKNMLIVQRLDRRDDQGMLRSYAKKEGLWVGRLELPYKMAIDREELLDLALKRVAVYSDSPKGRSRINNPARKAPYQR